MDWISVKDRLPELDEEVLVYVKGNSYNTGDYEMITMSNRTQYYSKDITPEGIEWTCKMSCNETVTHWMPLPEPPKQEDDTPLQEIEPPPFPPSLQCKRCRKKGSGYYCTDCYKPLGNHDHI